MQYRGALLGAVLASLRGCRGWKSLLSHSRKYEYDGYPDFPGLREGCSGHKCCGKKGGCPVFPLGEIPPVDVPYPVPFPVEVELPEQGAPAPAQQPPREPPAPIIKLVAAFSTGGHEGRPVYAVHETTFTTAAELVCPDNTVRRGDDCVTLEVLESKLGCQEGWHFDESDKMCKGVDVLPAALECEPGFERATADGEPYCKKRLEAPQQLFCPSSYALAQDGSCVQQVVAEPSYACSPDFARTEDQCCKELCIDAQITCSPPYSLQGGDCVHDTETPSAPVCPRNFAMLPCGRCRFEESSEPDLLCPADFALRDGGCVRRLAEPPALDCAGGMLHQKMCKKSLVMEPLLKCPHGFERSRINAQECLQITTKVLERPCPATHEHDGMSRCVRRLRAFAPKVAYAHTREDVLLEASCPLGFKLVNKNVCQCEKKVQADLFCPEGYTLSQAKCHQTLLFPPRLHCPPDHTLRDDTCELVITCTPQLACPEGFALDGAACTKESFARPERICPPDFTLKDSLACVMRDVVPPLAICPVGYDLQYDRERSTCRRNECVQPEPQCPPNYKLRRDGRAAVCTAQTSCSPIFNCAPGFQLDAAARKCFRLDIKKPFPTCPSTHKIMNDKCVLPLEEHPLVMCPLGFFRKDTQCVKEVFTKPKPVCPPKYSYDGAQKICYAIKQHVDNAPLPEEDDLPESSEENPQQPQTPRQPPPPEEDQLGLEDDADNPLADDNQAITEKASQEAPPQEIPKENAFLGGQIQVIQKPIPIPSPVVYLPRQAPPPPPPPIINRPARNIPVPMPVPIPKRVQVQKEYYPVPLPVSVPQPVPVPVPQPIAVAHQQNTLNTLSQYLGVSSHHSRHHPKHRPAP